MGKQDMNTEKGVRGRQVKGEGKGRMHGAISVSVTWCLVHAGENLDMSEKIMNTRRT